ncbi:acyl-CoA synthetase [Parahaliea mediterranea]|uniref:acyl-CoA synthetase n=1 Tax=Parahaliea mediterranea TaxID=651086 RepID=UPI000E2F9450|nr:acyl-CoA synthetase [Parahaliea mediterranea]
MPLSSECLNIRIVTIDDIRQIESIPIEQRGLPTNTYALLRASAARFGNRPALRFLASARKGEQSHALSYSDLLAKVTQAANAFHQLGVGTSNVVSSMLPNLPQTHYTIWGAEAAGIYNPINPMLEVEHVAAILNEAKTRVLVTLGPASDPLLWQKALQLQASVPSLAYVLTVNLPGVTDPGEHLNDKVLDFDALLAGQAAGALVSERAIDGTDIASYFHTGGTTGTPKLAPHTHFNEVVSSWQIACAADFKSSSKGLCGLPLFHVNAVFATGLSLWLVGGEAILATAAGYRTPAVIENFWHVVEAYRVTYFSAVPTIISALLEVPVEGYDLSSLEVAFCGAAPLATELIRKFEARTGLVLVEGYGQTEGTAASTLNPRYGDRRVGCVGLPLPYCHIRIVEVDAEGRAVRECATNETGVIAISGANVFQGYKQAAQNVGQWVDDGWFNTGDLGRLDEDGYLWLTGRSKDLIIRGGHNIDPQMIEEAYYTCDKVAQAAAIGQPDRRVGELPVVAIQLKAGTQATEEEMLAFGAAHIHERAAVPKAVIFVDTMPMTAVGKIFKPALRNDLIHTLVSGELNAALGADSAFSVTVDIDKQYGQRVTVRAALALHADIKQCLGDYPFALHIEGEANARRTTT